MKVVTLLALCATLFATAATADEVKSKAVCAYPVVGAVYEIQKTEGTDGTFSVNNPQQREFLERVYRMCVKDLAKLPEQLAKAGSIEEINQFLEKHGSPLRLQPGSDYGTAALLRLKLEWQHPGTKCQIRAADGQMYEGAFVEKAQVIRLEGREQPVAVITATNGDKVMATVLTTEELTANPLGLAIRFNGLKTEPLREKEAYQGVHFPKVSLAQDININWLLGLGYTGKGRTARIDQALHFIQFQMDELGAEVKADVALGVSRGMRGPDPLRLDRPFLVWIQREGLHAPVCAVLAAPDSWTAAPVATVQQ